MFIIKVLIFDNISTPSQGITFRQDSSITTKYNSRKEVGLN